MALQYRAVPLRIVYRGTVYDQTAGNLTAGVSCYDVDGNRITIGTLDRIVLLSATASDQLQPGLPLLLISVPGGSSVNSNPPGKLLLAFDMVAGEPDHWNSAGEGIYCPLGVTPSLLFTGESDTSGMVTFIAEALWMQATTASNTPAQYSAAQVGS